MKDRRPRTVSGGGQDASAPPLCVLAEIEPCHQTKPKIIIDFGQITVLVAKDECQTSSILHWCLQNAKPRTTTMFPFNSTSRGENRQAKIYWQNSMVKHAARPFESRCACLQLRLYNKGAEMLTLAAIESASISHGSHDTWCFRSLALKKPASIESKSYYLSLRSQ
jgi:hypothetical protein